MSSLTDLLNDQSKNNREFKKISLVNVDIEDILFNKQNKFPLSEMYSLQESIREKGLLNPPTVYRNKDDTFTLVSGHRRLTAILPLIESGEISPEIKCIVIPTPKDTVSEIESIYLANKNRPPLTEEELRVCVEQLIETWNNKPDKEKKGRMRDYIAGHLNISARTLQKYINEYNEHRNPTEITQNNLETQKKQREKDIKKVVKKLKDNSSLFEELEDLDIDIYQDQIYYKDKGMVLNEALLVIQKLSNLICDYMAEVE